MLQVQRALIYANQHNFRWIGLQILVDIVANKQRWVMNVVLLSCSLESVWRTPQISEFVSESHIYASIKDLFQFWTQMPREASAPHGKFMLDSFVQQVYCFNSKNDRVDVPWWVAIRSSYKIDPFIIVFRRWDVKLSVTLRSLVYPVLLLRRLLCGRPSSMTLLCEARHC